MARPDNYPPLPEFDDGKYYLVQLYRKAEFAGRTFSPAARQTVRGDVAQAIVEAIYRAEETQAP